MIKNEPKIREEKIDINRAQIEHRATWMGLIYEEILNAGADAEAILRRAIRKCGRIHGANFKAQCADPNSCIDFRHAFLGEVGVKSFEMDNIEADYDNLKIEFNYCALVNAWKKLGFDEEKIALLCYIAMEGDRGIAEAMGLKLDLSDTIAKGCAKCKLHFHK